jgi:SNF family Na+-dependent transporter
LYFVNKPNLFQLIIPLTCFIVGVVLGNLARTASNNAKILESENYMEKIGKVLGIIGIVVNAVIMAFYIIDALLRILLGISLAGILRGGLRYY